jgi:hypothetical protein
MGIQDWTNVQNGEMVYHLTSGEVFRVTRPIVNNEPRLELISLTRPLRIAAYQKKVIPVSDFGIVSEIKVSPEVQALLNVIHHDIRRLLTAEYTTTRTINEWPN